MSSHRHAITQVRHLTEAVLARPYHCFDTSPHQQVIASAHHRSGMSAHQHVITPVPWFWADHDGF